MRLALIGSGIVLAAFLYRNNIVLKDHLEIA